MSSTRSCSCVTRYVVGFNQTRVKYLIVLDSNNFLCFTCLVYWNLWNPLKNCKLHLLALFVGSISPCQINQAQKSVWIHDNDIYDPGLSLTHLFRECTWTCLFPDSVIASLPPVPRNEFKAYTDVKPVKAIRAKSQYLPPDEKTCLETSYSATYRGEQAKQDAGLRTLERRRIRSLYSEPGKVGDPQPSGALNTPPSPSSSKPPVLRRPARPSKILQVLLGHEYLGVAELWRPPFA